MNLKLDFGKIILQEWRSASCELDSNICNHVYLDGGQEVARQARYCPQGSPVQGVLPSEDGNGAGADETRTGALKDGVRQGREFEAAAARSNGEAPSGDRKLEGQVQQGADRCHRG